MGEGERIHCFGPFKIFPFFKLFFVLKGFSKKDSATHFRNGSNPPALSREIVCARVCCSTRLYLPPLCFQWKWSVVGAMVISGKY